MKTRRTFLLIAFLVLLALAICAVGGWLAYDWYYQNFLIPPGKGPKAEAGYQACQPLIEALEKFHAQEGRYPEMLEELVPAYLTSLPTEVNDMEIIYRLDGESYSLEFSYAGPGMNHCSYTPEKGWKCYGFY